MRTSTLLGLALLPFALSACCTQTWSPDDEAQQVITATSVAQVDLSLEWRPCDMSASAAAQFQRAALILGDGAAAIVDYQARIGRAVTPEEKVALTSKRVHRLESMVAQVEELRSVAGLATQKVPASSIAVVFTSTGPATGPSELALSHVAVLGPLETPSGATFHTASLRLAVVALVDVMEAEAEAEGILRAETKLRIARQ